MKSVALLLTLCWLGTAAAQECTQVPNSMIISSAYAGSADSVAKSAEECCQLCKEAPRAGTPFSLTCQVWTWCPWDRAFTDPCITTRFGFSEPAGPGTCFLWHVPEGEAAKADCQGGDCPWISGYTTATNPLDFQPAATPEANATVAGAPDAAPGDSAAMAPAPAPEVAYGDACDASSVQQGTMLITPTLNGDITAESQEQCCALCNKAADCHVWSYCPFSGDWKDTCTTTRFGVEEKARPKACFLWTLKPGAEPTVDQSGSRWVSGRKPVVGAEGGAAPAPPAVAAPASGGAEGGRPGALRAAVLLAALTMAACGLMGGA